MVCVVPDLAVAGASYERLGLVLTPETRHKETGTANRAVFVGTSADEACYLELISVFDAEAARTSGRADYIESAERGGGMVGLSFGVSDVEATSVKLSKRGHAAPVQAIHRDDGSKVCDVATIETGGSLPFRVSVIQYPENWHARYERSLAAGRFAHAFPLKRLDHMAAVAPDLDGATRYWKEVFEVPVFGEVRTPTLIIRQLKVGDAILELLGPASAESPMASRPASLISMAAWEVSGRLDGAVALARERGFTVSDPEAGVLPGTRRASIPAGELGGVGMQLLEYV